MRNLTSAFLPIAGCELSDGMRSDSSRVVAIVRLSETRRAWFVTGVQSTTDGLRVVGYEPGCEHSFGNRWFLVSTEFFEMAACATEEDVMVEILRDPIPLDRIEDASL